MRYPPHAPRCQYVLCLPDNFLHISVSLSKEQHCLIRVDNTVEGKEKRQGCCLVASSVCLQCLVSILKEELPQPFIVQFGQIPEADPMPYLHWMIPQQVKYFLLSCLQSISPFPSLSRLYHRSPLHRQHPSARATAFQARSPSQRSSQPFGTAICVG